MAQKAMVCKGTEVLLLPILREIELRVAEVLLLPIFGKKMDFKSLSMSKIPRVKRTKKAKRLQCAKVLKYCYFPYLTKKGLLVSKREENTKVQKDQKGQKAKKAQ